MRASLANKGNCYFQKSGSVKKDEKQATGDLGSQTQGCESSLMKRPGRKEPVRWRAGAWDPILLWPLNPSPKASTSPDINAEKQTIGWSELWLKIWSQGYVSTVKELKWGKDMEHMSWWMFGCVNFMGGLGVWRLELQGWRQPTEEKSLDPGSNFTQLHVYHQETTCFQRQKSKWVFLWAGSSSHKERNAERQYGSGKILQATGCGEWNAVFPQLTTQGTQQMELPWFRGTFGFCLTSTHWRGFWGGPGDRETKENVRKGKARKLSTSFLRSFQRPWTGGNKRSNWMRPSRTQNPVILFYSSGT